MPKKRRLRGLGLGYIQKISRQILAAQLLSNQQSQRDVGIVAGKVLQVQGRLCPDRLKGLAAVLASLDRELQPSRVIFSAAQGPLFHN